MAKPSVCLIRIGVYRPSTKRLAILCPSVDIVYWLSLQRYGIILIKTSFQAKKLLT